MHHGNAITFGSVHEMKTGMESETREIGHMMNVSDDIYLRDNDGKVGKETGGFREREQNNFSDKPSGTRPS